MTNLDLPRHTAERVDILCEEYHWAMKTERQAVPYLSDFEHARAAGPRQARTEIYKVLLEAGVPVPTARDYVVGRLNTWE